MNEQENGLIEYKPGIKLRIYWAISGLKYRVRDKIVTFLLFLLRKAIGKSNLTQHAETELRLAGLYDKDSDYDGMLAPAVMDMIYVFASDGHSGFSAMRTLDLFDTLARYKTLTPLTSNPGEWMEVTCGQEKRQWQNRRDSRCFSDDGGKTWYNYEDCSFLVETKFGGRFTCGRLSDEDLKEATIIRTPKCAECMIKESCERRWM